MILWPLIAIYIAASLVFWRKVVRYILRGTAGNAWDWGDAIMAGFVAMGFWPLAIAIWLFRRLSGPRFVEWVILGSRHQVDDLETRIKNLERELNIKD